MKGKIKIVNDNRKKLTTRLSLSQEVLPRDKDFTSPYVSYIDDEII